MEAAKIRRAGLWGMLLLTLYLVFSVGEPPQEPVRAVSEPARHAPRAVPAASGAAAFEGLPRRDWQEDAAGDPFRAMAWYVPPQRRMVAPAPTAPPLPYAYFGKMAEGEMPYAFLQKGNKVYVAKAGDTLDGAYRVESVSSAAVVFTYLPLNTQQTAALGSASAAPNAAPGDRIREIGAALGREAADKGDNNEKGRDEQADD